MWCKVIDCPLDAASLANHTAVPTSSSGLPNRPRGVCFMIDSTRSGDRIWRFCSAGKKPGTMAFTRTPAGANSRAKNCVTLSSAAFDAE